MNTQLPGPTEITPETALELVGLGLATMIDVRQPYELEYAGCLRCAESIPLLHFKQTLGQVLTREEQEVLDLDQSDARDIVAFIAAINRHQIQKDTILLCLCRSGKRSRYAVQLLRSINYFRCFSIAGGIQAMLEICPEALEPRLASESPQRLVAAAFQPALNTYTGAERRRTGLRGR